MALLPQRANTPENQEGMDDRSPLPAGTYTCHIVKSEFKATKNKNGHYLALQLKVLEGEHKGKTLFENLNLDNPNAVAVEIANKTLNSICKAQGKVGVEDSEELHQYPMAVTVAVDDSNPNYPANNKITAYNVADQTSPTFGDKQTGNPGDNSVPPPSDGDAPPPKMPWDK